MAARKAYQKALLPQQINEVCEMYREGYSTYYIAEKYYCCRQTIWEYVKGIKERKKEKRFRYYSTAIEMRL